MKLLQQEGDPEIYMHSEVNHFQTVTSLFQMAASTMKIHGVIKRMISMHSSSGILKPVSRKEEEQKKILILYMHIMTFIYSI